MDTTGYDKLPTVRERIHRFLAESMELGIQWKQAAAVALVSINESGALFTVTRGEHGGWLPLDCYPTRQVLALEKGNPFLGASGNLPNSWLADADLMTVMRDRGWLNGNKASQEFALADIPSRPNNAMPHIFDYLLDQRKLSPLAAFSIGPTQMYLALSPLTGGQLTSRFSTIEQLWAFWTARSVKDQWDTDAWSYLFGSPDISEALHQCSGTVGNACVESWLQAKQTGQVNWTDPAWSDYARRVATINLPLVYSEGRSLNYPGLG